MDELVCVRTQRRVEGEGPSSGGLKHFEVDLLVSAMRSALRSTVAVEVDVEFKGWENEATWDRMLTCNQSIPQITCQFSQKGQLSASYSHLLVRGERLHWGHRCLSCLQCISSELFFSTLKSA